MAKAIALQWSTDGWTTAT